MNANLVEDVIRCCGQFVPRDALSATASLERLCDAAGISRKLLERCQKPFPPAMQMRQVAHDQDTRA